MTTNTNPALATRGSATGFSFEANGSSDNNRPAHATQLNCRQVAPTAPASGTEPARDRNWWRRKARRLGSDWPSVIAPHTAVVMSWRAHHDPHFADIPMTGCPTCGADPCTNPSFCEECRKADPRLRGERRNRPAKSIPQNSDGKPIDALCHTLNYERRRPTPQTPIEASMHCVRERGLTALKEPANIERLIRCDQAAKERIDRRTAKLVAEGRVS